MSAQCGNRLIAQRRKRLSIIMRPIVALFALLLLAFPLLSVVDQTVPSVGADSFAKWNKIFFLHDGERLSAGTYDWLNTSGPVNPAITDYDSDGVEGITIKKNVPPQRYHAWHLFPTVSSSMNLSESLSAHLWVWSQGNESGTVVKASFFDITPSQFADPYLGTLIGSSTSMLTGPDYWKAQQVSVVIPSVTYALPAGHLISLVVERGDSINDWLIVEFDRTQRNSFVSLTSDEFISIDSAWAANSTGAQRAIFNDMEPIFFYANASDPFGSGDIIGASVTVLYAGNLSVALSMQPLSLLSWDNSSAPHWKLFRGTVSGLGSDSYISNVTARDSQGYPSWKNVSFSVVSADHFDVGAPPIIVSGSSFVMNVSARDSSNQIVADWVGTVVLSVHRTNKIIPANGTLLITSVDFSPSDQGLVNITGQVYSYSEENFYIRASCGSRIGWSELITSRSNPVVAILLVPSGPVELDAGSNQVFFARGTDYLGNLNTSWIPYWTVTPSIGSVTPNGLYCSFYAGGAGSGSITCTNNLTGANTSASITVYSGSLARIEITAPSYPLTIQEAASVALIATGYDSFNNSVSIAGASWYSTVSGSFNGTGPSVTFRAGYIPMLGVIECRLGGIIGSLDVQVTTSDDGPSLDPIPNQYRNEDEGSWQLSLVGIWHDVDGTAGLFWWVEDVNYSLYFILHDPTNNAAMEFHTQPDQNGEDTFVLWVADQTGYMDFRTVVVGIIAINDPPKFVNHPPTELYVAFGLEYTFDFTYYVSDVDHSLSELTMSSDAAPNIWFDSLIAHFSYSGTSPYFRIVSIGLQDPAFGRSELSLVVRVTKDIPPSLNTSLPDLIIDEGVENYYAFDLDDYFYDLDGSVLIYTTGFENIPAPEINSTTHRVYFSTLGEWSGVTIGQFTAKDPEGALKIDTVAVTVIPVNDVPIIDPIERIYVHYDQPYYLYLAPYVHDPDNSFSTLDFEFSDSHITLGMSATGAYRLEIEYPEILSGQPYPYTSTVTMNVTDPLDETASIDIEIYVTGNLPPQVVAEDPDQLYFTFLEDEYLNDTIRLGDLISDADDAELNFTISSSGNHLQWLLDSGYVNLAASTNWSGTETLSIVGRDDGGAWAFVEVFVIVTPVNDAPIVMTTIEDTIVTGGSRNTQYDISGIFLDSDNEYLTITAGPAGNAQIVGTTLFVSLPSGRDVITVTLQASDGEFQSSMVVFKVGVRKTIEEKIGFPYTLPLVLLAAGVAGYFIGIRMPRPYALENLFLIHNDGRLVAHVTKEENTNLDKDVVSAMFTAVQEFVRDSFQKGEEGLKKLEIGDKNVMIEKGKSTYLALIYSGWPQKDVFEMLPVLLRDIEERYKDRIERWNGTMKAVRGVESMLQEYMVSAYKPGAWHEEEEIAEEEWVDILNKEA